MKNMGNAIDFVLTWVDGSDKQWNKERSQYHAPKSSDDSEVRYRDWDNLRYWFRGVEKYAPWVRTIHFVTDGHVPDWLNENHPKLHIVKHSDFISQEYLPTFNSNAIEMHLHKIPGLSERFVYFNDDVFLINKVKKTSFFKNDLPCDMLALQPVVANPDNPVMSHVFLNNAEVLSRHFKKRENMKKQPGSYFKIGYPFMYFVYNLLEQTFPLFTGFYTVHGAMPLLKSTFAEVWGKEAQPLIMTSSDKFRGERDVSIYLLREWQKLSGEFYPVNLHREFKFFSLNSNNRQLFNTIKKQRKKMICINDAKFDIDYERIKEQLNQAFESVLPDQSSYEREGPR